MRTASRIQLQSHGWLFPLSGMHYRGVLLLIVGCWLALPSFGQTASAQVSAAPGQFKQALSGVQPNSLSVEELQLLTQAMISQDQLGDHWSDMLVWRFKDNSESIPRSHGFELYAQGFGLKRMYGRDVPLSSMLPAVGLDTIVLSGGTNVGTAIEVYHQLAGQSYANASPEYAAAADVVMNIASRLIRTKSPTPPALPQAEFFAAQNLWIWQIVLGELTNQSQPNAQAWVNKLDNRIPRNSTILGKWSDLSEKLSSEQLLSQPDQLNSSSGSADSVFSAIQRHKSQFLPNGQNETPATTAQIQGIVKQMKESIPHVAIEFCRSSNGYLAVAFVRISGLNDSKVAVEEAASMGGLLGKLRGTLGGDDVCKRTMVVLGIDCHFEPGDYNELDRVFNLSRKNCLLCPSLSVMTRESSSDWNQEYMLRYLHYSQDYDLSKIGSTDSAVLSALSGTEVKQLKSTSRDVRDVLMLHSLKR